MRKASILLGSVFFAGTACTAAETLVVDTPELAGISGFRAYWDKPVVLAADGATRMKDHGQFGAGPVADWSTDGPGALAFDAVHRSLLVRFPQAADRIAERLRQGAGIAKVELILPFKDTEFFPLDYDMPAGMSFLGDLWVKQPPRWHAVAWALRQPWTADAQHGPTFNAAVNGQVYWQKYGPLDEVHDRFPRPFGPTEVSAGPPAPPAPPPALKENLPVTEVDDALPPLEEPPTALELAKQRYIDGRLDLTALLTEEGYGKTVGERLRRFAECGVLVRKWEVYDARYWGGGYEWGVATGQRAILIDTPRLEITFADGQQQDIQLPPAAAATAQQPAGKPTAVVPSEAEFAAFKEQFAFARPAWAADWQWQRMQELQAMGGAHGFPETYADYLKWLDTFLSLHPRAWKGFNAGEMGAEYAMYHTAMPEPVKDNLRLYWWAWLMPDREYASLVHGYIGGQQAREYYEKTGDWRGNFSVYRTYLHSMGTTNFNSWATTGAMFGGWIIGDQGIMAEARQGYDHWMTRTWTWLDGTSQESIDHYYFAHTLGPLKTIADFAPGPEERLAGRLNVEKHLDELIACWHPNLRRFVSSSGRTGIAYPLYLQEGLNYIVHTLSKDGALTDLGAEEIAGRQGGAVAREFAPGQVALQTAPSPWASPAAGALVDDKPLPYEATRSYVMWGGYGQTPIWKKSYLGQHYGLASLDVTSNETVPVMAQWRRQDAKVASWTDLGTLLARYGINDTEFLDSLFHGTGQRNPNGSVGVQGGPTLTVQGRNRAIILGSPVPDLKLGVHGRPVPEDIYSLQMSIALFNFEATPDWKLYIDGQPVGSLPAKARFGQRLTLHDGVTYLGLLPIPASELGKRDAEVLISAKGEPTEMQGGGKVKVTLTIDAYNYHSETPLQFAGEAKKNPLPRGATPASTSTSMVQMDGKAGAGTDALALETALEPVKPVSRTALDQAVAGFVVQLGDATEFADFATFQRVFAAIPFESRWEAEEGVFHVAYGEGAERLEAGFNPTAPLSQPTTQVFPYRRFGGAWPYLPNGVHRDTTTAVQSTTGRLEKNGAILQTEAGKMAYLQAFPEQGTYVAINPYRERVPFELTLPNGITLAADGLVGQCRVEVALPESRVTVDCAAQPAATNLRQARALIVRGLKTPPQATLDGRPVPAVAIDNGYAIPLVSDWNEEMAKELSERLEILSQLESGGHLNPLAGSVLDWHLIGPFPAPGGTTDTPYPPEQGRVPPEPVVVGDHTLQWKNLTLAKPEVVDLIRQFGNQPEVCAYAYAEIESQEEQPAQLRLGSDDGIVAWWNGQEVLRKNVFRAAAPDQEAVEVTLRKGTNRLLLKITQSGGGWAFYCRLVDGWGRPIVQQQ